MQERPTYVRWRILALLMAQAGLCHFNRTSISVAGTEHMMPDFSITETQMGVVYSSYLFVYTLCMLPGGWLIDRVGPKRALLGLGIGTVILVPLTGASSLASAGSMLLVLCVVRAMLGLVNAPMHPGAARAVSFWFPLPERSLANGLVTCSAVLGVAATYYLFGILMDAFGWPQAFLVAGLVTLLLTGAWALDGADGPWAHRGVNTAELALIAAPGAASIPDGRLSLRERTSFRGANGDDREAKVDEGSSGFIALLLNPSLVCLALSYAALSYFQYLFFYWMQNYFEKVLQLDSNQSRLYATIPTVAMAVGMIAGGWLADRAQLRWTGWGGRAMVPMSGMAAAALLLALGIVGGPPAYVVICFALAMASLGACEATFWVTGVELGKKRGGLSGAILNTVGNAGGILGTSISPLFSGYFGWQAGLGLASFICLVGAVFWCGVRIPREVRSGE